MPDAGAAGLSVVKQELLRRLLAARDDDTPRALPRAPGELPPASYAQARLWLFEQLEPGSSAYNLPMPLRLQGPLDLAALQRAVDLLVERHEVLRSSFAAVDGEPAQRIAASASVPLPLSDLSALPPERREAVLEQLGTQAVDRPFDLAAGPLVRAALFRLAPEEHVLLLVFHHAVADGWSVGIAWRELAALYPAARAGLPSPLAPLPLQYADVALWQRRRLLGGALDAQIAYWKRRLEGIPSLLELPTDRPRPSVQTFRGADLGFSLPEPLVAGLRGLARSSGTTLFPVLLAAFATQLHRYTGSAAVVIGVPVAGRNRTELEGLIGCFVNLLALRVDFPAGCSFRQVVEAARVATLEALANQEVPFERLVEELRPRRTLRHTPVFQVTFALNDGRGGVERIGDLRAREVIFEGRTSKYDLSLVMVDDGAGVGGAWEYSTGLFEESSIHRFTGHLRVLLEAAVADPDMPIARLPLLTEGERQQLLAWSRGEGTAGGPVGAPAWSPEPA